MFYILRMNLALAKQNVDPKQVKPEFRQLMLVAGMEAGNSPQEVAVWIASQMPLAIKVDINFAPIKAWIRKRKINPNDPEMQRAFREMGIGDTSILEPPHA